MGGFVGSNDAKIEYVSQKVRNWVKDIDELTEIAKDDPQSALCALNVGMHSRWKFVQRVVKDTSELFAPLEDAIRNNFLPVICGRPISDVERRMLSLLYRFGGIGVQNPMETANTEYLASIKICEPLVNLLILQETDISLLDKEVMKSKKQEVKAEREELMKVVVAQIFSELSDDQKSYFAMAQEKGASSWLSSLPIKKLGYSLNRQEFQDSLALRYGWKIKGISQFCTCGKANDIDHALCCPLGGYTYMRHNALRNA